MESNEAAEGSTSTGGGTSPTPSVHADATTTSNSGAVDANNSLVVEDMNTRLESDVAGTGKPDKDAEISLDDSPSFSPSSEEHAIKRTWTSFFLMGPQSAFSQPNPPNIPIMTDRRRNFIAVQSGIYAMTASMNSSIMVAIVPSIQETFGITTLQTNLILTLSILLFAIAPLLWAPLSDNIGRRVVLLLSQLVAISGAVICILAPNYAAFIVGRMVQMAGSGASISVGAGVISDVFPRDKRGRALGTLNLLMLVGPMFAPPVAGVIAEHFGMRNVFVFSVIMNTINLALLFFALPETLESRRRVYNFGKQAAAAMLMQQHNESSTNNTNNSNTNKKPSIFTAMLAMRHPFVLFAILAPAIGYGTYYALAGNFARDLQQTYGLSVSTTGFITIAVFGGMMIGSLGGGTLADHIVITLRKLRGTFIAEDRLKAAWLGALVAPVGPVLYGWIIDKQWAWQLVLVALVPLGFANFCLQTVSTAYLVDTYSSQAASMSSVLNAMRWCFGAIAPLITVPGYQLGIGWFYTIVGALNVVFGALLLCVAFVTWFAMDRLSKEPWKSGKDAERQREALVGKGRREIPWAVVLFGGGKLRTQKDPEEEEEKVGVVEVK